MNDMNYFLPRWYVKDIIKRNKKRLIALIFIVLFLDTLLLCIVVVNKNKLDTLEVNFRESKTLSNKYNNLKIIKDNSEQNFSKYYDFFKSVSEYGRFKNINIDKKNISLEFQGKNESLLNLIESIENKGEFNIVDILYLNNESNMGVWKIVLK